MCVRFVENLNVVERFLTFLNCSDARKAEELLNLIKSFLEKIGIFAIPIVSQSYDGAAVMSGVANGLQKLLTNYHPHAIYIHFISHRLNFYTNKLVENQSRITGTLLYLYCSSIDSRFIDYIHYKYCLYCFVIKKTENPRLCNV